MKHPSPLRYPVTWLSARYYGKQSLEHMIRTFEKVGDEMKPLTLIEYFDRAWSPTENQVLRLFTVERMRSLAAPTCPSIPRATEEIFGLFDLLLPPRLRDEDLADGREVVHALVLVGAPRWKIYIKTFSTCGWCLFNAFGYVIATFLGRTKTKS